MSVKVFKILVGCVVFGLGSTNPLQFVDPIRGLLAYLDLPLRIQILTCWDYGVRLDFHRRFNRPDQQQGRRPNGNRNYQLSIANASVLNFPNVLEENQYLIIVDLGCIGTQQLLYEVGMKLTHRFRWMTMDSRSHAEREADEVILQTFQTIAVLPNSEIYCLSIVGDYPGTVIKQVYRASMRQGLILEFFGFWTNSTIVDYRSSRITSKRRRDLRGSVLRASLVLTNRDSVYHLSDWHDKQIDTISKVNYVLTNLLGDFVGGHIEYSYVRSWGYIDENSKWSGMIGDLVDNRSDIGASALFFTSDRVKFIDYIAMPTPTRSKFVFRSPKLSYTENVFLLPFDKLVWFSIIAVIILTSAALVFSTWFEFKTQGDQDIADAGVLHPSMLDAFVLVIGATCQQGSSVSPRSVTSRIIMLLVFLILMFLYTSYSANIVALLQSPSNKIQNLDDLLNSRLRLGADDTVFNRYYFTHTTEPIRKKIYQQKILNKDGSENFMPLQEGVELLRQGLFAFHMETGVGYKVVGEIFREDEKCGLQEIQYLQVIDPWYAIQKNSSYKELLKIGMMRIHEHGLQERENAMFYTKKPKCTSGGGKFITASLVDTRGAILILLWGHLFAVAAVSLEIVFNRQATRFRNFKNTQQLVI